MSLRAGIDIGTTGVRIVESQIGARSVTVKRAAAAPLPLGAVDDDGRVIDTGVVAAVLKSLWRKGRFRARQVSIVLGAERSYVLRTHTMPYLTSRKLMSNTIKTSTGILTYDMGSLEVDHHVISVKDIPDKDGGTTQEASVIIIAAHKEILGTIISAVQQAGIAPTSVDVAPFALTRFVSQSGSRTNQIDFVLHAGASTVTLVAVIGGQYVDHRDLSPFAGSTLMKELVDFLSGTFEEAEELKLNPSNLSEVAAGSKADEARQTLAAWADSFVREVAEDILSISRSRGLPVGNVWLSGGGSRLAGLPNRLGGELTDATVSLLRPEAWVAGADKLAAVVGETGQDVALAVAASGK